MNAPDIRISSFRGEYRLVTSCAIIGDEDYRGIDVLCLGDEVCEQLGAERDSSGYVFPSAGAAAAARSRVISEVLRFRHANP